MHLLYSRFFYKALSDLGLATENEPYRTRLNRGLILAEDGRKMSKRWGNVINPDDHVRNVGADAVRTYLAFIGPYNEAGSYPWNTNGLIGVRRFLERVHGLKNSIISRGLLPKETEYLLHKTIQKVGDDIEIMKFNTAVSQLMILSNTFQSLEKIPKEAFLTLLKLLAPFTPHFSEELWHSLGQKRSIHLEKWPEYDLSKLERAEVIVAVQIAGKTRGLVSVREGAEESEVVEAVRADQKLNKLAPESPSRIIYKAGRIINFLP